MRISRSILLPVVALVGVSTMAVAFRSYCAERQRAAALVKVPEAVSMRAPDSKYLPPAFRKGALTYGDYLRVPIAGKLSWEPFLKVVTLNTTVPKPAVYSLRMNNVYNTFDPQFSPNGKLIMFKAGDTGDSHSRYRLCFLDRATKKVQQGPDGLVYLKTWWAPSSNYVAYIVGGDVEGNEYGPHSLSLYIYDLKLQKSRLIASNTMVRYLAWSSGDNLLYSVKRGESTSYQLESDAPFMADIYRVAAKDGKPQLFIKNGFDPRCSPDGKKVAFFAWSAPGEGQSPKTAVKINSKVPALLGLYMYDEEEQKRTLLQPSFSHVRFGDMLWLHDNRRLVYFQMREQSPKAQAQFGIIDTSKSTVQNLAIVKANDYESIRRIETQPQFSLGNLSADGKQLYVKSSEYVGRDQSLSVEEISLKSIDLDTGKVATGAKVKTTYGVDWLDESRSRQ